MPVNSAAVLKQSQPAASAPCRGHVLRKAKVSSLHALQGRSPVGRRLSSLGAAWEGRGSWVVLPVRPTAPPQMPSVPGLQGLAAGGRSGAVRARAQLQPPHPPGLWVSVGRAGLGLLPRVTALVGCD